MPKPEGKTFEFFDESKIENNYTLIETFDFDDKEQYIKIETEEFSAVCPFSGLPDIATVKIEYYPEGLKCVELKSLKYYFTSFRNIGIYQERVTTKLYDDLKKVLNTNKIKITTLYNTRGGINTTCEKGNIS